MAFDLSPTNSPISQEIEFLRLLPRPRRVKLKHPLALGFVLTIFGTFGCIGLWMGLQFEVGDQDFTQIAIAALLILFAVIVLFQVLRNLRRDPLLLAEGEVAAAEITREVSGKHGRRVWYRFQDFAHREWTGKCAVIGADAAVGLYVPVFYDPQDPRRHALEIASYFGVEYPGRLETKRRMTTLGLSP